MATRLGGDASPHRLRTGWVYGAERVGRTVPVSRANVGYKIRYFDGAQFAGPNVFGYNARSEVTSAMMGTHGYSYVYDAIGDQKSAKPQAQPPGDRNFEAVRTHGARSGMPRRSGNCNRVSSEADGEAAAYAANALNQYSAVTYPSNSPQPNSLSYDADGNLTSCGPWTYTWDAENRMSSACSNGVLFVTNVYDHQSRRIRKEVYARADPTSNYEPVTCNVFLYDGWNVLCDCSWDSAAQQWRESYYTWGLDLSGTAQGAGGVGGLLAVTEFREDAWGSESGETHFPTYDANGNVTAYLDQTGAVAASREFDAFGNTISEPDPLASEFAYWFSTKRLDAETGMYDYGYRFYAPELGRWVSRDPLGERGCLNVYVFCGNKSLTAIDVNGLFVADDVVEEGGVSRVKFRELYKKYSPLEPPPGDNVDGACKAFIHASFTTKYCSDDRCSKVVVLKDTYVKGGVFWVRNSDASATAEAHEMRHKSYALESANAFDKILHFYENKCYRNECAWERNRYLVEVLKYVKAVQENSDRRLEFEDYGDGHPTVGVLYGQSYQGLWAARERLLTAEDKMKHACGKER